MDRSKWTEDELQRIRISIEECRIKCAELDDAYQRQIDEIHKLQASIEHNWKGVSD